MHKEEIGIYENKNQPKFNLELILIQLLFLVITCNAYFGLNNLKN